MFVTCHIQNGKIEKTTLDIGAWKLTFIGREARIEASVENWLEGYLKGKNQGLPEGIDLERMTPFSQTVLQELSSVPFGQTISYSKLARKSHREGAARAVGTICRLNPYPLLIPCHRVISASGDLGGFAYGLEIKIELLEFERAHGMAISCG